MYEIINGIKSPEGRLPVSWPKTAGQLPYFYNHKNTGRPADSINYIPMDKIPIAAWQSSLGNDSHYLDVGFTPHFPFGYGLSYTTFKYENVSISKDVINFNEDLEIKVSVTNSGKKDGKEIVQLYIQDIVGSITRPVKELKRFKHVFLKSGETKEISFKISSKDLEFVNHKIIKAAEEGTFNLWVGPNVVQGLKASFTLKK
ncbi:fibronectin type III-like domain-contianing protein [Polaribacter atrinae]|mgnify:CR=1 FL=1|uniref:fibronectin type III-like domain-contianing protein n=1 Tax=Polaribacter atrinae TaxID=1333662 RepID=UPI0030F5FABB